MNMEQLAVRIRECEVAGHLWKELKPDIFYCVNCGHLATYEENKQILKEIKNNL